jgi:predicted DNA-binding transcriptional regulator YafY
MDMRAVLDKIVESLEGDISIEPDWLSEHVGVLPEDRVRIDPEVWAQVAGHIERREAMRADYQSFAGRVSRDGLHPLHLLAYHGKWYVLARNAEKGQIETLALSRFRGIEAAGSTFTRYISGNGYVWPFRAPDWRSHLDTQGSRDMARLNAFMVSIPWYSLVPSALGGCAR